MTIAVPVAGDLIYQHFGHAPGFRLYQIENDVVSSTCNQCVAGHGHDLLAQFLTDHHVTTLICGCIGCGAKDALKSAGITLYGGVTGEADEAVDAFLAGFLDYDPDVRCSHHGGCGSHCH